MGGGTGAMLTRGATETGLDLTCWMNSEMTDVPAVSGGLADADVALLTLVRKAFPLRPFVGKFSDLSCLHARDGCRFGNQHNRDFINSHVELCAKCNKTKESF